MLISRGMTSWFDNFIHYPVPTTVRLVHHHITKVVYIFYIFALLEKGFDFMQWIYTSGSLEPTGNPGGLGKTKCWREGGIGWMSAMDEPMADFWRQARGSLEAKCLRSRQGWARVNWDMNKNKIIRGSGHFWKKKHFLGGVAKFPQPVAYRVSGETLLSVVITFHISNRMERRVGDVQLHYMHLG